MAGASGPSPASHKSAPDFSLGMTSRTNQAWPLRATCRPTAAITRPPAPGVWAGKACLRMSRRASNAGGGAKRSRSAPLQTTCSRSGSAPRIRHSAAAARLTGSTASRAANTRRSSHW